MGSKRADLINSLIEATERTDLSSSNVSRRNIAASLTPVTESQNLPSWADAYRNYTSSTAEARSTPSRRMLPNPVSIRRAVSSQDVDAHNDDELKDAMIALLDQIYEDPDEKLLESNFFRFLKEASGYEPRAHKDTHEKQYTAEDDWAEWNSIQRDWTTSISTGYGYIGHFEDLEYEFLSDEKQTQNDNPLLEEMFALESSVRDGHNEWFRLGVLSLLNDDDYNALCAFRRSDDSDAELYISISYLNLHDIPSSILALSSWMGRPVTDDLNHVDLMKLAGALMSELQSSNNRDESSRIAYFILCNCTGAMPEDFDDDMQNGDVLFKNIIAATIANGGNIRKAIDIYESMTKSPRSTLNTAILYHSLDNHNAAIQSAKMYYTLNVRSRRAKKATQHILSTILGLEN